MRYARFSAVLVALLSVGWAQSVRQTRTLNLSKDVVGRLASKLQRVQMQEQNPYWRSPQARITNRTPLLTWLKPSQSADTVRTNANSNPYTVNGSPPLPVARDTVLANNSGTDIDPTLSNDCDHAFFDSVALISWYIVQNTPIFGNMVLPILAAEPTNPDTFIGGGVAERFDINPCALMNNTSTSNYSVYVKGASAYIMNNVYTRLAGQGRDCDVNANFGSIDLNGNNLYDAYFELLDTTTAFYPYIGSNGIYGPYPGNRRKIVYIPVNQLRIAHNTGAASGGPVIGNQCVASLGDFKTRWTYAYFDAPVEIDRPYSFFLTLRFELYNVAATGPGDSLFVPLVLYGEDRESPCYSDDTLPGRTMDLHQRWDPNTEQWLDHYWVPAYHDLGGEHAHFWLLPIVYEAPGSNGGVSAGCSSTGQVIRSGNQGFGLPYPNPVVSDLNLKLTSPAATTVRLVLTTTDGRQVGSWERPVPAGEGQVSVDVGDIPAGAYILQALTPYGVASFWVTVVK